MEFAINRSGMITTKKQHRLLNLQGDEVTVEAQERVTVLHLECSEGNQYCAVQKKAKGLLLLPLKLFTTFNKFKEAL